MRLPSLVQLVCKRRCDCILPSQHIFAHPGRKKDILWTLTNFNDIFWSLWDFHYPQKYHPYKHFLGNLGKLYFQWLVLLKTLKQLDSHTHVKEGWLLVNNTFAKCLPPATKCWRLFIVTCHNCPNLFKTFLRLQLQDKIFQSIKSGKQAFRPQLSNNDSSDAHLFPSLQQWTRCIN